MPSFALRFLLLLPLLSLAGALSPALAEPVDCNQALVLTAPGFTAHEQQAALMLREEVTRRTGLFWRAESLPHAEDAACTILLGTAEQLQQAGQHDLPTVAAAPEAYTIATRNNHDHARILIVGRDERGVLFGVGALLRKLSMASGGAGFDRPLNLSAAPEKPVRSHQIGYRYKNNTYDAWSLSQFEQQIRDLAIFGANTVQLIAPVSDDKAESPLSPAPPLETLLGIDRILDRYGLNCDLYYPEMEPDYAQPEAVTRELARFEDLIRQMPRLDALWIPGGDPGHTAPALLFPLVERETAILRRYHPQARVYLSAQGMDAAQYAEFYRLLATPPTWLTGVFFGPQSRESFAQQRAHIPASLPMIFYPDIAHTMHAQFPVAQWDPVFALTEGREPIDPRPTDEAIIYRHFSRLHSGFVTYSEGVNDDVNKMLWSQWGWDEKLPARTILEDYARLYAGPEYVTDLSQAIEHLEKNWRGPLLANSSIAPTLETMQAIDDSLGEAAHWRVKMILYRAYYDAYLQQRARLESQWQSEAIAALRKAPHLGTATAMQQARAILDQPVPDEVLQLRDRVFALGGELYHDIGLQLSTKLYGAANWERGANLDHIGIPLNDRIWLEQQFTHIEALPTTGQNAALDALLAHYQQPAAGFRDDLGQPQNEPHLVRGAYYEDDPAMLQTAIDGVADMTSEDGWPWWQLTYAEALYEHPLALHYEHLKKNLRYRLHVVYAGESYALPLRLVANGSIELQPFTARKSNPQEVDYSLPATATASGKLTLEWTRPAGIGGSGRGRQIAEVTLTPEPR